MPNLKPKQIEAATDAESLVRLLIQAGRHLPPRLRERILAFGPEVIPPLVTLMEDEALSYEDAPGEGWPPIRAVELLGEMRTAEAAEPMLRLLAESDPESILHDQLLQTVPKLGAAALEPALAAYAATTDPELRGSYRSVLANLGVPDERIYDLLVEAVQRDLRDGINAMYLADYGDPKALPLLSRLLDQADYRDSDELMANQAIVEIEDAIRRLGGELTPEQQAKFQRITSRDQIRRNRLLGLLESTVGRMDLATSPIHGVRALGIEGRPAPPPRKVGRNDPCPCGSGKKFKKCHLGKD